MSADRRLLRTVLLAATLVVAGLAAPATVAAAGRPPAPKPTIVLVHGAWADASSWAPVTTRLQQRGYTVLAVPNPLRGLSSDAAYLTAVLQQRTSGPVVLVGHSYGGAVVTNAALSDPDVKALVYVDAFVPDQGETVLGLQGGGDPSAAGDEEVAHLGAQLVGVHGPDGRPGATRVGCPVSTPNSRSSHARASRGCLDVVAVIDTATPWPEGPTTCSTRDSGVPG